MSDFVTIDKQGAVLLIGVNRPAKRNAWNLEIIQAVAAAYSELRDDTDLRVGVVHGYGDHFTAGLDLTDVLPAMAGGSDLVDLLGEGRVDPWAFLGEPCPKPVIIAAQGRCYTLGIELMLAAQVAIVAEDTLFAQLEVARGIFPFGGGAPRLATHCGKAGMKWLLTGETFDAAQALAAGLVTEVVPVGQQLDRAVEVAKQIAKSAPLGVQATLAGVRAAEQASREAAVAALRERASGIFTSDDAMEGMNAMVERRDPVFKGK